MGGKGTEGGALSLEPLPCSISWPSSLSPFLPLYKSFSPSHLSSLSTLVSILSVPSLFSLLVQSPSLSLPVLPSRPITCFSHHALFFLCLLPSLPFPCSSSSSPYSPSHLSSFSIIVSTVSSTSPFTSNHPCFISYPFLCVSPPFPSPFQALFFPFIFPPFSLLFHPFSPSSPFSSYNQCFISWAFPFLSPPSFPSSGSLSISSLSASLLSPLDS